MTAPPTVDGLDLSLTATGVATPNGTATLDPGDRKDEARLRWILRQLLAHHITPDTDLVVIEAMYASPGKYTLERAGLLWLVRCALHKAHIPCAFVSPSTLKKYATGHGAGEKVRMAMELYKRTGIELSDDNQVDAWWLRAAGHEHLGAPIVDLPKTNVQALTKATWPAPSTPHRPTAATTRSST